MNTYALYVSAKMIRTIQAENVADAVIWAAGHGAHQWFGSAAIELVQV